MTGYGKDEDRRRSQEAGFNAHLVKPVNLEDLRSSSPSPTPRPRPDERAPAGCATRLCN